MDELRQAAYAAGFDAIAVTPATPLVEMEEILKAAQEEGRYPEFAEQDTKKRIDPRSVMDTAVSIISVAVAYKTIDPGPPPPLHGTVSRSAWGLDYHTVLNQRMDKLVEFLKDRYGVVQYFKAVDTSPLIDRAIAVRAGLGVSGENCAVYVSPHGSWVFLGEILVDVELPTLPTQSTQKTECTHACGRCVKACPTGALFAPGKINAHRCISYLTQKSGSIPMEFRKKIGNKLWGCDICQQACPENRAAKQSRHAEFEPIVGPHVPLIPLLEMTKREFQEAFGETSIAWRGKNVLQRNACIILGNQKAQEALAPLKKCAKDHPSEMVREAAEWAVHEIESAHS